MPNRILKESICSSDSLNELSWFEEVVFYRLIVKCDDYGRYDGRAKMLKGSLFPLKDNVTASSLDSAIDKLASVGLVRRYNVNGKPYLHLPTWSEHQSVRAANSKYPDPEDADIVIDASEVIFDEENASESTCKQMYADDFNGNQPSANVPDIRYSINDIRYTRESACARAREDSPTKLTYGRFENVLLTEEEHEKLREAYPTDYQQRVDRLSAYLKQSGKSYESHYATICIWADEDKKKSADGTGSFDADEFFALAVKRV